MGRQAGARGKGCGAAGCQRLAAWCGGGVAVPRYASPHIGPLPGPTRTSGCGWCLDGKQPQQLEPVLSQHSTTQWIA